MRARLPSTGVAGALVVFGALGSVATAAAFAVAFSSDPTGFLWSVPFVGGYAAGVVAYRRRPDLVAARRLLLFGTLASLWIGANVAISEALERGAGAWLGPSNVGIHFLGLAMGASLVALVASYPDGVYRARYEGWVVRAVATLAVAVPVALLVTRPTLQPAWVFAWDADAGSATRFPAIDSPLHVAALEPLGGPLRVYLDAGPMIAILSAGAVLAARYRRLPDGERLRVRWPVYGALTIVAAPVVELLVDVGGLPAPAGQPLQIAALTALPVSAAVGLVRPDLFDLDRAVRRSLVYAPLWLAIAGAYVGIAAAVGLAAASVGTQLAVVATMGATLLFNPVRRRLARRAAAWAYGEPVSGDALVRRLGRALEHALDTEELAPEIASVARDGLGVAWVRVIVDGVADVTEGHRPPGAAAAHTVPLVHAGHGFGRLECGPHRRRTPDAFAELLDTFAHQAALALHNARLASELQQRLREIAAQASELAASRSRLVAAHESARRQIERDIHDGAQQEIVALMARIALARNQLGRDPAQADGTLGALQSEAAQLLEHVRELASGIHPSVLSDHGLAEAVEIRATRLPLPVDVRCDEDVRHTRFTDAVEGAAYYFLSEGLANTLKHAGATRATVTIGRRGRDLEVAVIDDGCGFEPGRQNGTGLSGLADRVEALGGRVHVVSAPGKGTHVRATLPVEGRIDA